MRRFCFRLFSCAALSCVGLADVRAAGMCVVGSGVFRNAGVGEAERTGTTINAVDNCATQLVESMEGIASAINEQTAASTEFAHRVESIALISDETSAAMQDAARSANRVNSLAGELEKVVGGFRV